jgi:drug/metabolite transporter (DMT)-like permease
MSKSVAGVCTLTRVASHACVNPLVAVALGYFAAGEVLTMRMIMASALVIVSVFLILKTPDVPVIDALGDR